MLSQTDIFRTLDMIDHQHLDVRTITMGISLRGCADPNAKACARKIYDRICTQAERLVATGCQIEAEYGIPIFNKRISVTPISLIAESCQTSDYTGIALALDKAAKTCGVDFIGGFSALVQKGMDALMKGRTTFVIAHRLSTVRNSDCIMVLDHGRIIERGSHQELIERKGTYYQLYTGAFELE